MRHQLLGKRAAVEGVALTRHDLFEAVCERRETKALAGMGRAAVDEKGLGEARLTSENRRIPLPGSVADVLQAHMKEYPPVAVTLPWEDPASPDRRTYRLVLTTSRLTPVNRSELDGRAWKRAIASLSESPRMNRMA